MRLRFFAPDDEEETSAYVHLCHDIDDFWRRFGRVCAQPAGSWVADLRAVLARIHVDLGLEVQEHGDGTRTLVIVPLGGASSWPLCRLFVERAPERYPWTFECQREAVPLSDCIATTVAEHGIDLARARARVGVTRGHLLEVVLASPELAIQDEHAQEVAERFVRLLLGDKRFESWIAGVSLQPAPRSRVLRVVGDGELPELPLGIDELADAVDAASGGILLGLPDAPLHTSCERAEWTLFELDERMKTGDGIQRAHWQGEFATSPPPLCDTPPQADLLLAASSCPEALKCLLTEQPFASQRFSRHGERFCYLKLRVEAANDEGRLHHRMELEDLLDRALVPGRLGCVVGNGLGRQHVYIDLALSNVDASLSVLRSRLERAGVRDEAWLFFFDDEWSNEWLALNARTGRPLSR